MDEVPVHVNSDHVHVHPRHTGTRWFDITMAVSAIFISTVSLYVAAEHGKTEKELVEATTWPFPQSVETDNFGPKHGLMFGVSNAGTGPAKVYNYEVSYKGVPVSSPRALLHMCCRVPMDKAAYRRVFPDGTLSFSSIDYGVVRPGETIGVFVMPETRATEPYINRVDAEMRNLTFHACYCSVLNQCWNTDLRNFRTINVPVCLPPAHPYDYSDE